MMREELAQLRATTREQQRQFCNEVRLLKQKFISVESERDTYKEKLEGLESDLQALKSQNSKQMIRKEIESDLRTLKNVKENEIIREEMNDTFHRCAELVMKGSPSSSSSGSTSAFQPSLVRVPTPSSSSCSPNSPMSNMARLNEELSERQVNFE